MYTYIRIHAYKHVSPYTYIIIQFNTSAHAPPRRPYALKRDGKLA